MIARHNVVDGSRVYFRMRAENRCGIVGKWGESLVYEKRSALFVRLDNEEIGDTRKLSAEDEPEDDFTEGGEEV